MTTELAMADEKKTGRANQPAEDEKKPEYTTFRIFAKDGEDLSELADKRGTTIAKLYHELCAPLIRKQLIEETEKRLQELKTRKDRKES